jgi:glycosidase
MTIAENYPPQVLHCNMNLLGTHDTPRILTALVDSFDGSREDLAKRHLSSKQYTTARELLMAASVLQYTLPGSPSLYYGDEAGMEGGKDPFNRRTYPWGDEDRTLLEHFKILGRLRKEHAALREGMIRFFRYDSGKLGFFRELTGKKLRICINRSEESWEIPAGKLLLGHNLQTVAPTWLTLNPLGFCILEEM